MVGVLPSRFATAAMVSTNSFLTSPLLPTGRLRKRLQCFHGGEPGAEILRRERPAARLAQVFIDVGRIDPVPLTVVVDPLKQLLAGNIGAPLHDAGNGRILNADTVRNAALAAEFESQLGCRGS